MFIVTIIALPYIQACRKRDRTRDARELLQTSKGINTQLKLYESMNGFYPNTE
jgi:hypothetical protein